MVKATITFGAEEPHQGFQKATVFQDEAAEKRLTQLGLPVTILLKASATGYLAKSSCTRNDAPMIPGINQWNSTGRSLREDLIPKGWEKSDDNNYSCIISPCKTFRIVAFSGNLYTGKPLLTPSNRTNKGPCTIQVIKNNTKQLNLWGKEDQPDIITTWILLFYDDKKELRTELSLPAAMDKGYITGWFERIILPSQPIDDNFSKITKVYESSIDIDIRKRI
ncbi:MAG: hypothetical protein PHC34_01125 [Candidatus Gastranaerophilales bacterium]|nr:hypothetical protein [Candidatus Gastranaerophilales bacterium]